MKQRFQKNMPVLALLLFTMVLSATVISSSFAQNRNTSADTIPQKKEKKITDLDEAIRELDKGLMDVERELKEKDWKKMEAEIKASMKEIDVAKMQADVEKAIKAIDVEKINADIQKAIKEVDTEMIKAEIAASLARVDMKKIKAEMEKIREVDVKDIQLEMEKIKPQVEASLKDAKLSIEKAKAELKEYKTFLDALEKDGLINKKEQYSVTHKDGKLTVNGKEQPESIYNKYRIFLGKHKSFTINRDNDDFNIDLD